MEPTSASPIAKSGSLKLILCRYHLIDPMVFHYKLEAQIYKMILSYINDYNFVQLKQELKKRNRCVHYAKYLRKTEIVETRLVQFNNRLRLGPSVRRQVRDLPVIPNIDGSISQPIVYKLSLVESVMKLIRTRKGIVWLSYLQDADHGRMSIVIADQDHTLHISINSPFGRRIIAQNHLEKFFEGLIQPEGVDDPIPDDYWEHKTPFLDLHDVTSLVPLVTCVNRVIRSQKEILLESYPYVVPYVNYESSASNLNPEHAARFMSLYESQGYTVKVSNYRVEDNENTVDIQITCAEGNRRIQMGIPNVPLVDWIHSSVIPPEALMHLERVNQHFFGSSSDHRPRSKGLIHQLGGWKVK